jgi:hypothetical protein
MPTGEESSSEPIRTATSMPSLTMSPSRSDRSSDTVTSGCAARKAGTSGATWRRPKPAGAVTRTWPLAFTPPADHRGRHALELRRGRQAAARGHGGAGLDLLEAVHRASRQNSSGGSRGAQAGAAAAFLDRLGDQALRRSSPARA